MHPDDFDAPAVRRQREDLALALRAAAHHGLAEGVCNHFSVELPDRSGRFLLNPRGLLWQEVQADDIVVVDGEGRKLAGRHAVEPTAMFIHAAVHRIAVDAAYNGLALDASEGERIARAMAGRDVAFLGNHGVVVCGARIDHAYDDLYYLERACMHQVLAQSAGRPLAPVPAPLARQVGEQTRGERLQSELFFEALRRML